MMSKSGKKKILFVCYANMIRSQMAEGFARDKGSAFLEVYSAGIHPTGVLSPEAIAVMKDKGVDISEQKSKGIGDVPIMEMDYVINMSGYPIHMVCPPGYEGTAIDWKIEDPVGKSVDYYRSACDAIEERVNKFVKTLWKGSPAK